MERVTSALDLLGVVLTVLAAGWWAGGALGVPVGCVVAALLAWAWSLVLQGGPRANRRGGGR